MSSSAPPAVQVNPTRGIALMLSSVVFFTLMSAFIKAADRIPAGEAMFFRSVMALPIIIVWLIFQGGVAQGIRTNSVRNHAVRGIVGSCAMGLGFAGLKYLPLPEVTAIRFVTPVILLILASIILGERLRLIRISAVIVGLIGVLIIIWPRLTLSGEHTQTIGALMVLGSACLAALAQVWVKGMSSSESTTAIVFWFSCTTTVLSLFTIPFGWVMPQGIEWVYLISAGFFGGLGQIFVTSSYKYADAGVLAPFTYTSMIWSLILGYIWFGDKPTVTMLLGATLVIGAGIAIVLRERRLGTNVTARRKVKVKEMQ